jgi:hypothetical protein
MQEMALTTISGRAGPVRNCFVLLGLAVQLGACCNAPEQYAISAGAADTLTIAGPGRTTRLQLTGRISDAELGAAQFRPMYEAIRGQPVNAAAVVITVADHDEASGEFFSLTLALPADLRRGARFTVGGAFPAMVGGGNHPGTWGTRNLREAERPEVAFSTSAYTFPPPQWTNTFVALQANGTIEVVERGTGWFKVRLALVFTDEHGRTVEISGNVQAQAERHTPSCT